jgi:hypothetical protein
MDGVSQPDSQVASGVLACDVSSRIVSSCLSAGRVVSPERLYIFQKQVPSQFRLPFLFERLCAQSPSRMPVLAAQYCRSIAFVAFVYPGNFRRLGMTGSWSRNAQQRNTSCIELPAAVITWYSR